MIEINRNSKTIRLRKVLFWDIDVADIDAEKSKRLVVERVITRGSLEEFIQLTRFYEVEELRQVVVKIGYLDPKTLHFISGYLGIPKSEFLCYKKQQSNRAHWNS